jgi:hypothetical protein
MGWRHDIHYKLIINTQTGTSHDAMSLINQHITLDETCTVNIEAHQYLLPTVEGEPDYIERFGQRGARVTIDFKTMHIDNWNSAVYHTAVVWIEAESHDVVLFSLNGDDELANVYGLRNYTRVEVPEPPSPIIEMLKARAAI